MTVDHGAVPAVAFEGVHKRFTSKRGTVEALIDVSFPVWPGEFVSIVGPSGCGKSTLLKLAAGVAAASSGVIKIGGHPVNGPVEGLGMVFQSPVLLEWRSVLANVLLPVEVMHGDRDAGKARAIELLQMVGLAEFMHRYPSELSGGMQQRVAISRALVIDPPLLLMDEPFGALDALTRDEMALELLRIWERTRKTIVFVTHGIEEAVMLSDRVVVMTPRPGRVLSTLEIDLPRPRTAEMRYDALFNDYAQQIRYAIYHGGTEKPGRGASARPGSTN